MTNEHDRLIFLFYALPCAEEGLRAHKISQEDYAELNKAAMSKTSPSADLLKRCFPKGFALFEEDLNFMSAEASWLCHVGSGGNCAVKIGRVEEVGVHGARVTFEEGKTFFILNPYKLSIKTGGEVIVHRQWIIRVLQ